MRKEGFKISGYLVCWFCCIFIRKVSKYPNSLYSQSLLLLYLTLCKVMFGSSSASLSSTTAHQDHAKVFELVSLNHNSFFETCSECFWSSLETCLAFPNRVIITAMCVTIIALVYCSPLFSVFSCFYHLQNIAKLGCSVSRPKLEILIHAFVSSCLDLCNVLYTCWTKLP